MNLKLELIFKDRVGIVADISSILAGHTLNILSMEVERHADRAHVYLEAENGARLSDQQEIFQILGNVQDLMEIKFIHALPQEKRERRFRVVLDNIRDGVISIDTKGHITTINRVAREALRCLGDEIVGHNIKELKLPDYNILECLKGNEFNNLKKDLFTATGRYQYFATGRPIRNSAGHIIGAVEIAKDMQEIKRLAKSISEPSRISFSDIIGQNDAIVQAISFAQKIAAADSIVSIRGASGTGKELFALAIHAASGRKGLYVPINCAALPEQLLESELFGYVGGTFTGGKKDGKPGLFEIAQNGTVLLDEIGEMPPSSQAKILRLIQEKSVRRIGSSQEIPIDTRIITSTNRNLEQMVAEKSFRQDLYYRINVLPIHIPPLAERADDIPLLVEHFLFQLASRLNKHIQTVTQKAIDKLHQHNWPGNVRELKNVVERAAILCDADIIDDAYILFNYEIGNEMQKVKDHLHINGVGQQPLRAVLADYERTIILKALEKSNSIRKAAKGLGISHTALLNKLKKYNIETATKQTTGNKTNQAL